MAGIYLHFPFCTKKCGYCDFFSEEKSEPLIRRFLGSLQKEMTLRRDWFQPGTTVETVYFGGGTPSLLTPARIHGLLSRLFSLFQIGSRTEISIEANPGTVDIEKLYGYREAGINRISIGVQSFQDPELKLLGRIHTANDAGGTIRSARKAGFEDVGIDLIYGLPGQTLENWKKNIRSALSFNPTHLSAYALTWNGSTVLGKGIETGLFPRPEEDAVSEMFLWTSEFLEKNGFEHYEISNFSRPGHRCRHNEGYWTGEVYLGLGPSAHSFGEGRRFWNISDIREYITLLSRGKLPVTGEETLSPDQCLLERIALGLRRKEGILIEELDGNRDRISTLLQSGFALLRDRKLSLTARGFLLADEIAADLAART